MITNKLRSILKNFAKILLFFSILLPQIAFGQEIDTITTITDTIFNKDSVFINKLTDSIPTDSLLVDTVLLNDTIVFQEDNSNAITDPITFAAKDSMYISVTDKRIILFGTGELSTIGIDLKADSIGVNFDINEIRAKGLTDSTGHISGKPVFTSEDKEYTADSMRYNFDTKKGLVYNVITQESEGFLHGKIVKIQNQKEMHIWQGKYTTCDHPHPHYYIDLTKAKLKSNDKIISGLIYFVILDIPMPIFAPFGFFPLSHKNTSGIHFPSFDDRLDLGFGLNGAGYYWAINDYMDVDLTTKIYTKGSWGFNIKTNLKKRYLATAKVQFDYFHFQDGERILATTKINNSYKLLLNYNQDTKARPNSHFSANINFVYGNITQYNAKDIDEFVNTTTTSSAAYQKTFSGTPFRMSASMNASQNLRDSTINLRFPTVTLNMNQLYPFKPKNSPAKGRWYEKISIKYNSSFANSLNTHDTILMKHFDEALKEMRMGYKATAPVSMSFNMFKYINASASFNNNMRVYPQKIEKSYVNLVDTQYVAYDTTRGVFALWDYNTSFSLSTRLFGLFRLNIGRLKAVRHTLNPRIGYTYRPDFGEDKYGYYAYEPDDTTFTRRYSYFYTGIYGVPPIGEQQSITFGVSNNFEAKILTGKDTSATDKKIKLLDNLSLSGSYNFAKDSLQLSPIRMNASASPIKNTRIGFSANFEPYALNSQGQLINEFELNVNHRLARMANADLTISTQLNSNMFSPKTEDRTSVGIKWDANLNYHLNYRKVFNVSTQEFDIKLNQTASVNMNINPTPNWRVGVRTGYDFDSEKITSTTFDIFRDLHCWQMTLNITPFGRMKGYNFMIRIKSSMFDAIKFKRERHWQDNQY